LRTPAEYSLETSFLPQLFGQIQFDLLNNRENLENIDTMLNMCLRGSSKGHRDAMVKEYKRREEKKKEELRQ
jgi:hypothetical protein